MKPMVPVPAPKNPPNMIGFGSTMKRSLYVVVFFLGLGAVGYVPIFERMYKAKTYSKMACNEMVRYRETPDAASLGTTQRWKTNWEKRMAGIGLHLDDNQFSFEIKKVGVDSECRIELAFAQEREWPLLGRLFDDAPTIKMVHQLDFTHLVRKNF